MDSPPKKPIYKRAWFWLLVLFVLVPIGETVISSIANADTEPADRMINEEYAAEQAKIYADLQAEEQRAQAAAQATYATEEEAIAASIAGLISDTLKGEHYSCEVVPDEDAFGYNATLTLDLPDDYADDPESIMHGIGDSIASQADSRLMCVTLIAYHGDEQIFHFDGYVSTRFSPDQSIDSTSLSSGTTYVLNTDTKKFHRSTCSYAQSIESAHKSYHSGSRSELIADGYAACGHCDP